MNFKEIDKGLLKDHEALPLSEFKNPLDKEKVGNMLRKRFNMKYNSIDTIIPKIKSTKRRK